MESLHAVQISGDNEQLSEFVSHLKTLITEADVAETRDVSEQYNQRAAALGDSIHSSVECAILKRPIDMMYSVGICNSTTLHHFIAPFQCTVSTD